MPQPLFETRSPMPARPRVKIDLQGDELHLVWRNPSWGGSLFLLLWLTGWTAGCGFLLRELLTNFEWFMLLFATPFFAAWFAVAAAIIYMLFGRQTLVLTRHELLLTQTAIVVLSRREIPLNEVDRAVADTVTDSNSDGPPTISGIVRINTIGQPVEFAKGVKDDESHWLAETINVCLDQMAPHRKALSSVELLHERVEPDETASREDELYDDESALTDQEPLGDGIIVFEPARDRFDQPSDSRWMLSREGRATQFAHRGQWSLGAIAGLLFINLFWNGIVGVFVVQLVKDFQWFLALFLIPFEVIGLCMIAGLVFAITAPAWGQSYSIRFGRIERRWWGPLMGGTKSTEFDRLDRVEISSPGFGRSKNTVSIPPKHFSEGDYKVALIDGDNHEVASIESITKGEAYWIADTITAEHPEMFDRDR